MNVLLELSSLLPWIHIWQWLLWVKDKESINQTEKPRLFLIENSVRKPWNKHDYLQQTKQRGGGNQTEATQSFSTVWAALIPPQ